MPGTPLNLNYPVVGDTTSVAVAKLVAILQAFQADIEPKILPSEFSWTSDLSAQGHALSSLSKVQLDNLASAVGLPTGTLYMQSGDLFVQTSNGAVRLTLNGQINASGLGGISGDFGGTNPARVTYTDLTDTYSFTGDTNDYSDLECQLVKLRNNGNWTTLKADPAQNTAQTWQLGAPNASGLAVLRQTNAGLVQSSGTVDQDLPMSGSISFSGSGKIKHGNFVISDKPRVLFAGGGVTYNQALTSVQITGGAPGDIYFYLPPLETWRRYISVTIYYSKTTAGTLELELFSHDATAVSVIPVSESLTPTTNTVGLGSLSVSFTTPQNFVANKTYHVRIKLPAVNDTVRLIAGLFDSV